MRKDAGVPPENGLSCQQLAISNQLRANNELIQAVGMPSAKSNSVRVEVTSTWLLCTGLNWGVKRKVGTTCAARPKWEELHPPQRQGGAGKKGKRQKAKAKSTTETTKRTGEGIR